MITYRNTGRMSSGGTDKVLKLKLVNMQNIPRTPEPGDRTEGKIYERMCFVPEKGHILVDADYSGQEQIVLANFSMEPSILDFYRQNLGDMHSYIASKLYPELRNMSLTDIKKNHKDKRQVAKIAGFAINYGGNGQTIADQLSVPVAQGEAVYNAYFEAFPKLRDYFKKCEKNAISKGYIFFNRVTGRKSFIEFFDQFEELKREVDRQEFWDLYREEKRGKTQYYQTVLKDRVRRYFNYKSTIAKRSLNYPIQGTSADITKIAAVYFMEWLEESGNLFKIKLCNMIHDEILIEVPLGLEEEASKQLKYCMEKAGEFFCPEIPLKAEPCVSTQWEH